MNRPLCSKLAFQLLPTLILGLVFLLVGVGASNGQIAPPPIPVQPAGKQGYKVTVESNRNFLGNKGGMLKVEVETKPSAKKMVDEQFTLSIDAYLRVGQVAKPWTISVGFVFPAGNKSVEFEFPYPAEILADRVCAIRLERGEGDGRFNSNDLIRDRFRMLPGLPQGMLLIDSEIRQTQKPILCSEFTCWDGMSSEDRDRFMAGLNGGNFGYLEESSLGLGSEVLGTRLDVVGQGMLMGMPLGQARQNSNFKAISFADVPDDPRAFDGIDRIIFRISELRKYCEEEERRESLERWVAAGGNLIVAAKEKAGEDSEVKWSHASEIFPILLGNRARLATEEQAWFGVNLKSGRRLTPEEFNMGSYQAESRFTRWPVDLSDADSKKDDFPNASGQQAAVLMSEYVAGRVLAIGHIANDPVYSVVRDYTAFENRPVSPSILDSSSSATLSPIPGAGNPPILFFIILLFTFLFLIGPMMIVYIRRKGGHAHRWFFAVPVISCLTCFFILGYSYITNLGSQKARIKSVTVINPATGMAFNQSMMAYYCGSQPNFYRYEPDIRFVTNVFEAEELTFKTKPMDEQIVSSARIAPRNLHFVLGEQAQVSDQKLEIRKGSNGKPEVLNGLGSRIQLAALRFEGRLFVIDDVEQGGRVEATEVTPIEFADRVNEIKLDYQPEQNFFSRPRSYFFLTCEFEELKTQLLDFSQDKNDEKLLASEKDFIAFVDEDPFSERVAEPFSYKMRSHIIHGKH